MVRALRLPPLITALALFFSAGSGFFGAGPGSAAAQSQERALCEISVRVLSAEKSADTNPVMRNSVKGFAPEMSDQLEQLPFDRYQQLDLKRGSGELGQNIKFELAFGEERPHRLSVALQSVVSNRVQIGVHWVDGKGRNVVQTKMRVPNGESVVLGTDDTPKLPMVIGLQVFCPNR